MDKEIFKKEVSKLVIEYGDKGFTMTTERAAQWHDFLKDYNDQTFSKAVDQYIRTNTYSPSMADILKIMRSYTELKPLDQWNEFIGVLKEVQEELNNFGITFDDTDKKARAKVEAIYEKLSSGNKRYFGDYRNFLYKAENYDYQKYEQFEKSVYLKTIEELGK